MVAIFDVNVSPFPSHEFHVTITLYSIQSAEKRLFCLEDIKCRDANTLLYDCMIFKLSKYGHVHINTLVHTYINKGSLLYFFLDIGYYEL